MLCPCRPLLSVAPSILPPEQATALEATVYLFAQACNHALGVTREREEFRRFKLLGLVYKALRVVGLSANLAVQAIARVSQRWGRRARAYRPTSCAFDGRTLSLRGEEVSLTTVWGASAFPSSRGHTSGRPSSGPGACRAGYWSGAGRAGGPST
jgi:hypothetical protein